MSLEKFVKNRGNRRDFLETSTRSAAGVAAGLVVSNASAGESPAQQPINVAVIGTRTRGGKLAQTFAQLPSVRIHSLCDVDTRCLAHTQESLRRQFDSTAFDEPEVTTDFRRLLQNAEIDAVVIATPDHWHAHMTLAALEAGKDIYLEKPLAHNIAEEQTIVRAVDNTDRIVQVGLQQRSAAHFQSAIGAVRNGSIGDVALARAWTTHRRQQPVRNSKNVPPGVNYDSWTGPVEMQPFESSRFHHFWRWSWNFGTGEAGNWGIHMLDIARLALNVEFPQRVSAHGGQRSFQNEDTPDWLVAQLAYPDKSIVWEHRQWSERGLEGRHAAVAFYGTNGTLIVDRAGWKIYDSDNSGHETGRDSTAAHCQNFVDCVRSRRQPIAPVACATVSSQLAHLCNVAWRVGREISLPTEQPDFAHDAAAQAFLSRRYRENWELG